jgi:hypothetical protein
METFCDSTLFCQQCHEEKASYVTNVYYEKALTLGCPNCPINIPEVTANTMFNVYTSTEAQVLNWYNGAGYPFTYFPIEPEVTRFEKAFSKLFEYRDKWKQIFVPWLAKECLPLVIVTRTGRITATVARRILMMIGNNLMNPYEVFDKILYHPAWPQTQRLCIESS